MVFNAFQKRLKKKYTFCFRAHGYRFDNGKRKSAAVFNNLQFRRKNILYQRHTNYFITIRSSVCGHRYDISGLYTMRTIYLYHFCLIDVKQ